MDDGAASTPPVLIGTYTTPAWKLGRRVWCRVREQWCIVTSFTHGRIPWPRARAIFGDASAILVNAELEWAIRTESAKAIVYWFGVNSGTVWKWRKAFGITRTGTPGSKKLRPRPACVRPGCRVWTAADKALLETDRDDVIAKRLNCTVMAVKVKRIKSHIPAFRPTLRV